MGGRDRDRVGDPAVRHGDVRGRGDGGERGDTRDDLERDAGLGQGERLLSSTSEDVRVAALETHDVEACASELDEQLVDLLLVEAVAGDAQRVCRSLVDELRGDEPVVDDRVARPEPLETANGDQPGVAGPGSHEGDRHPSRSRTTCWK